MGKPKRQPATLRYVTSGFAPGYRDLTLNCVDSDGNEYRLELRPDDVQRVIFACADAAKQIGNDPPLDWDQYKTQIFWPNVTPWKRGDLEQSS